MAAAGFLVFAVAFGGLLTSPAQAQRIKPDFFGMHDRDWSSKPSVPVGSANLTTSGTYWPSIQSKPGAYNWARLDAQLAAISQKRAKPMIVLGASPVFASSRPKSSEARAYMPKLKLWRRYVTAVAKRYGRRLDYQIWPEPNGNGNWLGTPRQMAKLTVVASMAISKHAGSRAVIVSPSVALRLPYQRQWMQQYFRQRFSGKSVGSYLDVVALNPFPAVEGSPEDSLALVQQARRLLATSGVRKPVWVNEVNYGIQGGNSDPGADSPLKLAGATKRAYVIRTFALMAGSGVRRVYWYGWFNDAILAVKMADSRGRALAGGKAYDLVRRWLVGTNVRGVRALHDGVVMVTARVRPGEVRRIYWKPRGRSTITTPRGTWRAVNQQGSTITKRSGVEVRVTKHPVMVVSRR